MVGVGVGNGDGEAVRVSVVGGVVRVGVSVPGRDQQAVVR